MSRIRPLLVLAMVLATVAVVAMEAQAAERTRRGSGRGLGRGSLLGLLRLEQVQKEMKLTDEQTTKVRDVTEKLGAEMRKQYTALREIQDREQQRAKRDELRAQFDEKTREQLRDVLQREQMIRLYQIRMQVRPVVDSLASKYVADKLKLTDEQKKKLAEITKEVDAKRSEVYGTMRDASQEQRTQAFQKLGKIRSDGDEQALALLTAEQKEAFEKMKGEKIELQMRRGPR